jgi:hypothetical protein
VKNIEALLHDGGEVTLGAVSELACVATAADGHNTIAMLARRDGEMLSALLRRLDTAIGRYHDSGDTVDEVNRPSH